MDKRNLLIDAWQICHPIKYVFVAIACALGIRIILSILQGIDRLSFKAFWYTLRGYPPKGNDNFKYCGDRWQAFALAVLELNTFPILIKTDNWTFIGAWIGFKVLGHWNVWKEKREVANRFLVGVGLVLIASLLIMTEYVSLK